jgi:hypothetical protein
VSEASTNQGNATEKKSSRYTGFALAASFSFFAILLWIAPTYIGFSGFLAGVCYVLGGLAVTISFVGALTELGELLQIEALGTFGVGLLFLVPGLQLHLAAAFASLSAPWPGVLKVGALLLDALGVFLLCYGAAEMFDALSQRRAEPREQRHGGWKETILTVLSFVSATLPILGFLYSLLTG